MAMLDYNGFKLYITIQYYHNCNGRFQKISIPYHGRLSGFLKGRGGRGSRLWNSEGMGGGVFMIGYPKALVNSTGGISGVESVE